jgi:hypothetical protein
VTIPLDSPLLVQYVYPLVFSCVALLIRVLSLRKRLPLFDYLLEFLMTMSIGLLIALYINTHETLEKYRWIGIFFGAMLGGELIRGALNIGRQFSRTPMTFIVRLIRIALGKPMTADELKKMMQWEQIISEQTETEIRPLPNRVMGQEPEMENGEA